MGLADDADEILRSRDAKAREHRDKWSRALASWQAAVTINAAEFADVATSQRIPTNYRAGLFARGWKIQLTLNRGGSSWAAGSGSIVVRADGSWFWVDHDGRQTSQRYFEGSDLGLATDIDGDTRRCFVAHLVDWGRS